MLCSIKSIGHNRGRVKQKGPTAAPHPEPRAVVGSSRFYLSFASSASLPPQLRAASVALAVVRSALGNRMWSLRQDNRPRSELQGPARPNQAAGVKHASHSPPLHQAGSFFLDNMPIATDVVMAGVCRELSTRPCRCELTDVLPDRTSHATTANGIRGPQE